MTARGTPQRIRNGCTVSRRAGRGRARASLFRAAGAGPYLGCRERTRGEPMSNATQGEEQAVYVRRKGETRGPVTLGQLRRGVETGEVPSDSKVAKAGADEWEAVGDFLARHGVRTSDRDARDRTDDTKPRMAAPRAPAGPWRKITAIGAA